MLKKPSCILYSTILYNMIHLNSIDISLYNDCMPCSPRTQPLNRISYKINIASTLL